MSSIKTLSIWMNSGSTAVVLASRILSKERTLKMESPKNSSFSTRRTSRNMIKRRSTSFTLDTAEKMHLLD